MPTIMKDGKLDADGLLALCVQHEDEIKRLRAVVNAYDSRIAQLTEDKDCIPEMEAEIGRLRAVLTKISDPLMLDVTGTGMERALRMITTMQSIAKESIGQTGKQDADAG